MNNPTKQLFVAGLSAFAFSLNAQAAITYVNAEEGSSGNTKDAGGATDAASWTGWTPRGSAVSSDPNPFGNFGGLYQSQTTEANTENLTTTIAVGNGEYEAYVFFWTASNATWDIKAAVDGGTLVGYNAASSGIIEINATTQGVPASTVTGLSYPGTATDYLDGNRILYAMSLGPVTVTTGELQFEIDAFGGTGSNNSERTWYDGVGYAAVPEPSSTALLGLGGLALILRRRK